MPTKLEKLLQDIDPSKTIDEIERNLDRGVMSYHRSKNMVYSYEECEECIADMAQHLFNIHFNQPKNYKNKGVFAEAFNLLIKEYGSFQTIYQIMTSGAEGGIYTILKTLARLMTEEYSHRRISSLVSDYLKTLSSNEIILAAEEYIKLNKHIIPIGEKQRARITFYFDQTLLEYPFMIKKLRSF